VHLAVGTMPIIYDVDRGRGCNRTTRVDAIPLDSVKAGWDDLVRRVVCPEVNRPV
jgi:hypothetical protein